MSCSPWCRFSIWLAVLALGTPMVGAVTCSVPSVPHDTIQAAADDPACTQIALGAQLFVESVDFTRSVQVVGDSSATTIIEGRVRVTGASTTVELQSLMVDASALPAGGCFEFALDVTGGGRVTTDDDVVVVNNKVDECPLFADHFEIGTTSRWSRTVPQ